MSSACSVPQPKVQSNLESFLHSVTPVVCTKPLSLSSQKAAVDETVEYFTLKDLWECYEEWSAYGLGTPVAVKGSDVVQYYAPCLSAIQLYTNRDKREGVKLSSGVSEAGNVSGFLTNNSNKTLGTTSIGSSIDHDCLWPAKERDPLAYPYFQYSETISPFWRLPFVDKIGELADNFPGLKSLKSIDLSPASWMSVSWSPIYHIPKGSVEDFTTYFLTYHTLSSCFQDTQGSNGISFPYGVKKEKVESDSENKITLPPFGLSSMRMQEHIWIDAGSGDHERLINLHSAAESWLKQLKFGHHDFDYYARRYVEVEV
ncbi:hypothetical protein CDL12_18051 [Handroanthus impetiginosus]|uniref:Uncharacterized protein n=1 Tax=Handroanthus impetiginosus TaxID=429701 RepID=A0A2G9GVR2_9LAMI|nr:hypothetical protein CDL12_18051 [Handroanthus impetiginosus]